MAKKSKGKRRASSSAPTVRIVQAPAPRKRSAPRTVSAKPQIIRVSAPKAAPVRRRRSSGGGGGLLAGLGGKVSSKPRTAIVIGSAALGYAHKEQWLNKLPLIGKAGPITSFALLGWAAEEIFKIKLPSLVHDMVTAGLSISAFNLGASGGQTIVGESYPGGAVFYG
jgi:hypothetical protein